MANTSKNPSAKSKAAPKKAAVKTAKKKPTKVAPDFYALRQAWLEAKDEVAYRQRILSRANATQNSIQDRRDQMDAANTDLLKAHNAEKAASEAFTSAQRKARS